MSEVANFGFIFDAIVSILLLITITYAVILNRKLNMIRDGRQDMETLVRDFTEAVKQAEQGLAAVRAAAQDGGDALQSRVDAADRLADDLAFLMKKGDLTIGKLEEIIKRSRNPLYRPPSEQEPGQSRTPSAQPQSPGPHNHQPQSRGPLSTLKQHTAPQSPNRQVRDFGGFGLGDGAPGSDQPAGEPFRRQANQQVDLQTLAKPQGRGAVTGVVPGATPVRTDHRDNRTPPAQKSTQSDGQARLSAEESQLLKVLQGMR